MIVIETVQLDMTLQTVNIENCNNGIDGKKFLYSAN